MGNIIKSFGGVITNGDQQAIPHESLLRSRNMRPELGLIKKTFGAGAVNGPVTAVVPGAGKEVVNIFSFNHPEFDVGAGGEEYSYFAIVRDITTAEITVVYWDFVTDAWLTMSGAETPTILQKDARNPYFIDNRVLRILGGAIKEIAGGTPSDLWIGWIDREFYDEGYKPTAAWWVSDRAIVKPDTYGQADIFNIINDIALSNVNSTDDTLVYIRYSFMYDGAQESLLSPAYSAYVDDLVNKMWCAVGLYDTVVTAVRSSRRITGMRFYKMSSGFDDAAAILISEISFLRDPANLDAHSTTGYSANVVEITNLAEVPAITNVSTINEGGDFVAGDTSLTVTFGAMFIVDRYYRVGNEVLKVTGKPGANVLTVVRGSLGTSDVLHSDGGIVYSCPLFSTTGVLGDYYAIQVITPVSATHAIFYTIGDVNTNNQWNGDWYLSYDNTGVGEFDWSPIGGYCGTNVLTDENVDFTSLRGSIVGLNVIITAGTGGYNGFVENAANDQLTASGTPGAKHSLKLNGKTNSYAHAGANDWSIGGQPYLFIQSSGKYYLYMMLDVNAAVMNGATYGLQGAVSTRVNSDYAKVIGNRTWQAYSLLDPDDKNEEQFAGVNYSEEGQLDVMPVSNLILINDREGGGCTGLEELYNLPVITTKQGIFRINAAFGFNESAHNIGNLAKHGTASAGGRIFVCWEDGIYALTVNNLAVSDETPTERLKVSLAIEDTYLNLSRADKALIQAEIDQSKGEIVFTLGTEVWAFNYSTDQWREIVSALNFDMLDIDENADLMVYDDTLKTFHTFANHEAVKGEIFTKFFNIDDEIKQGIRYIQVRYLLEQATAATVEIYGDGNMSSVIKTFTLAQSTSVITIPLEEIRRYVNSYAIRIVEAADSILDFEIHKIMIED